MAEGRGGSRLRIFMRSHAAENRKNRPHFYGKTACLASLIRAAEAVTPAPELVFVNDGPVPADRERLMISAGEVIQGEFGSNRRSYRATMAMAARRGFDDADLVWFAEDDYLYAPDAFEHLVKAAERLPEVAYFAMYIGGPGHREAPQTRGADRRGDPAAPTPGEEPLGWVQAESTTSSFAARRRQLLEDVALLRLMPYTGGAFDHTTCLTLQSRYPFTRGELLEDLLPFGDYPAREWLRPLARGVVRSVLGLRALRRPSRRRMLYRPTRELIAHLEVGAFDPSEDWETLARESSAWATGRVSGAGARPGTVAGQT